MIDPCFNFAYGYICREAAARSHTTLHRKSEEKMRYLYELSCPIQSRKGFSCEVHDARNAIDKCFVKHTRDTCQGCCQSTFCSHFSTTLFTLDPGASLRQRRARRLRTAVSRRNWSRPSQKQSPPRPHTARYSKHLYGFERLTLLPVGQRALLL